MSLWINFLRSLSEFESFIDTDSQDIEEAISQDPLVGTNVYQRAIDLRDDKTTCSLIF